jgi:ribosomal-protein-alanine N-acetyltransferase
MRVIETKRLLLCHLRAEDLEDLAALSADPEFTRFLRRPRSIAEARERAAAYLPRVAEEYATIGTGFYATIYRPEERFIGRCGLLWQEVDGARELEIAYGIAPAYWGRGLATEAARALKEHAFARYDVPRLISLVHPENVASQRVAEKNGMRRDRQTLFHGSPCNVYVVERAVAGAR